MTLSFYETITNFNYNMTAIKEYSKTDLVSSFGKAGVLLAVAAICAAAGKQEVGAFCRAWTYLRGGTKPYQDQVRGR